MVYKKIQNEKGDYKDNQDVRFTVLEAHEAMTPQGKNIGWEEYPDLATALNAYGLIYAPIEDSHELRR